MSEGRKLDSGKLRYDLIDPAAEAEMVAVLTYGAAKYSPDNWRVVPDAQKRYIAALRRHLASWQMGEPADLETGLHHLAHAACCVHFLLGLEVERGPGLVRSLPERLECALKTARRLKSDYQATELLARLDEKNGPTSGAI